MVRLSARHTHEDSSDTRPHALHGCVREQAAEACRQAHAQGLELDVWSYGALIKGYCQQERLPDAMRALAAMQRQGVTPNVVRRSWSAEIYAACIASSCALYAAQADGDHHFES